MVVDVLSWIFLLAGSAFLLISAVGMLRMPDFFTRMHAAGIADTLGIGLMVLGMALQAGFSLISVKLFLILAFVVLASPAATHALAQAALGGGRQPILKEDRRPRDKTENSPANSNEEGAKP